MNWDQVEGKWKQLKGSAKQRWGKLTDDDLTRISGKKDELVGRIQERYGITREEAQRQADLWSSQAQEAAATAKRAAGTKS
ncbi:MAG: CsbD family protein [Bryobacteraceae bacterium]